MLKLNQFQAKAVADCMASLNNVGFRGLRIRLGAVSIRMTSPDRVLLVDAGGYERYRSQQEFFQAYNLA